MLAGVFELVAVQSQAADQENPHVVFRAPGVVFPAILAGGAFRGQGLCRDCQAKDDVCFDLACVGASVGGPDLNRAGSPDIVQVQIAVSVAFVVGGMHIQLTEPGFVQAFVGDLAGGVQALDEAAIGALCVVAQPVFPGSQGFEDQLFLLVKNLCEIGDLGGIEALRSDVDVLAGIAGSFRSGFAQDSDDLLQRFDVFVAEDGRDHLGGGGAASEAGVADRFPFASRNVRHRPAVVGAAGVAHRAADHAVDRLRRLFAADVRIFQFGSEFQLFHLFHRFVHFRGLPFGC